MRGWMAFVLALLGTQAQALSCMVPDPVRTFQMVDAAPERWGAVVGRLDFNDTGLPDRDLSQPDAPPETWLRGQLVGHSLTSTGWDKPFQGDVALKVQCFGPWCAHPVTGGTYLVFLQREATRHVATADPCGEYLFENPSPGDLQRVFQCFSGGPCTEAPLP